MSETTKELNEDILRLVFQYLNARELHNAYLVCKSWWEIGKSVNKARGPLCITRKKMEENQNYLPIMKNIIRFLVRKPSFCMFMTNDVINYDNSESCHCSLLPSSCFSIRLENLAPKNKIFFSSLIFPDTSNIQINNYTFVGRCPQLYFCPEIYNSYDSHFHECTNLKNHFDPFLETERASTSCLILWCKIPSLEIFTKLIRKLTEWYPKSEVAIWGGAVDNLIVCNRKPGMQGCNKNMDFALFFINGQHMEVTSLVLDQDCETKELIAEKFRILSESIILKEHSIAFMYTSHFRLDFYEFESCLFKEYFPSVKLIHTVGKESFGGIGLIEFFRRMQITRLEEIISHSALMILTYN